MNPRLRRTNQNKAPQDWEFVQRSGNMLLHGGDAIDGLSPNYFFNCIENLVHNSSW